MTTTREEFNKQTWEAVEGLYNDMLNYFARYWYSWESPFNVGDHEVRRKGYIVEWGDVERTFETVTSRAEHDWLLRNYAPDDILKMVTTLRLMRDIVFPSYSFYSTRLVNVVEELTGVYLSAYIVTLNGDVDNLKHVVDIREHRFAISDYIITTSVLWWSDFLGDSRSPQVLKKAFRVYNKLASLIDKLNSDKERVTTNDYVSLACKIAGRMLPTSNTHKLIQVVSQYAKSFKDTVAIAKVFRKLSRLNQPAYVSLKEFREPVMSLLLDVSDEVFEENKHLLDSRYKRITYKGFVEEYFKNKGHVFKFDTGVKAPKLSTQLSKQKVPYTNKEIIAITEFKEWLFLSLLSRGSIRDYDEYVVLEDTPNFLVVDTKDFSIPYNVDRWAFQGSCIWSGSGSGSHTHLMLKQLGVSYLKAYSYQEVTDENGEAHKLLAPYARTYFYREGGDIAHAGTYSNGNYNFICSGNIAKTSYEATTFILCVLFNKAVDEFKSIRGIDIDNDDYDTEVVEDWDKAGVWSNMSDYCDYSKRGTADILYTLDSYHTVNWNNIQEDFVGQTIPACNNHACITLTKGE